MSSELVKSNGGNSLAFSNAIEKTEIETHRALAETQMRYLVARKFPRNTAAIEHRLQAELGRYEMAEVAEFALPVGGSTVRGASVRLAELIAQNYGNLDLRPKEVVSQGEENGFKYTDIRVSCTDLETGFSCEERIRVPHIRYSKQGMKKIEDLGELERLFSQRTAARMRQMIFKCVPAYMVAKCLEWAKQTLKNDKSVPIVERINSTIKAFATLGVQKESLEKWADDVKSEYWTAEIIAELRPIYTAIQTGEAKKEEYFLDLKTAETSEKINALIGEK